MRKKILVVDDEESIRLLYQEELRDEGYEVEVAADAKEALERFEAFQPDLITLDVQMPGMDGIEVLKLIRERSRDLPVILCTAFEEYKQNLATWASDAYLVKSANLEELKNTIREILKL